MWYMIKVIFNHIAMIFINFQMLVELLHKP